MIQPIATSRWWNLDGLKTVGRTKMHCMGQHTVPVATHADGSWLVSGQVQSLYRYAALSALAIAYLLNTELSLNSQN